MVAEPMPIAITGVACRLPGALDPAALWQSLCEDRDPFVVLSNDRWDPARGAELPASMDSPLRGAQISDFDLDWQMVQIPPVQAARLHRMERVALQTMVAALRDGGEKPGQERARVILAATSLGLDPSVSPSRHIRRLEGLGQISKALVEEDPTHKRLLAPIASYLEQKIPPLDVDSMGATASLIAGRLANLYDFGGGHLVVDGGMASSLAALEVACTSLRSNECDLVLLCALSPILCPSILLAFAHAGLLGTKRPRPFVRDSRGTLLGEGCVALVLRRLSDVDREEASCHSVITGIAGAGVGKGGLSGLLRATTDALHLSLAQSNLPPSHLGVVYSRACGHGPTDEAEAKGLAKGVAEGPVFLSSPVPTFGFLQGASGLLCVLTATLALTHRRLARTAMALLSFGQVHPCKADEGAPSGQPLSERAFAGVSDSGLGSLSYHAVLTTRDTLAKTKRQSTPKPRPGPAQRDALAITGCGVIFPQANDVASFWKNILGRVDAISDLPAGRWNVDELSGAGLQIGTFLKTRLAGVVSLPTIPPGTQFGPEIQDPALRMALLASSEALLDAGYTPGRLEPGRVQVVLGQLPLREAELEVDRLVLREEFLQMAKTALLQAPFDKEQAERILAKVESRFRNSKRPLSKDTLDGFSGQSYAAQIAAQHDFRGPAFAVDAACASSLVAVEVARQALLSGAADMVVAGGLAANLVPEYYLILHLLGFLSQRGAPSFTSESDGFVPAEGAGFVVLRRLRDALLCRDKMYAVIRGVGLASDGKGRSIFAPSSLGQKRAIQRALSAASASPQAIDHVEAHGTGTKLADQTEAETYAVIYGERDPSCPLSIGTLKGQIGHLSAASGIAGLIKTALALREGVFPPSLKDTEPASDLPFSHMPIELATEARPWNSKHGARRLAGVSAFGLGGVNGHVILEEPPAPSAPHDRRERKVVHPPSSLPPRGTLADRFTIELVPLSLPKRTPRFPLSSQKVLLLADRGGVFRALAEALAKRGAQVQILHLVSEQSLAPLRTEALRLILDLTPLDLADDLLGKPAAQIKERLHTRGMAALTVVQTFYERLAEGGAYVALTLLGGLGLLPSESLAQDPTGAFYLGLVKGLKQERPECLAKVIDFGKGMDPKEIAERSLVEIEDGNDRCEVAYLLGSRRLVPNLRRAPHAPDAEVLRPLQKGDVYLFSGGGRGVTFACASALAQAGAIVVVCGRTERPLPTPEILLSEEEFAKFHKEEFHRRRRDNQQLTPVAFAREIEPLLRKRELHRNLHQAERLGLPLHYEVCDVTDLVAVSALVKRVRARFGKIDGVVHGAMVEWSHSLPKKSRAMMENTLRTKVEGLCNLLSATAEDPPRSILCFGSGAGRFGNRGQVDYSAANALLATLLQSWVQRHGQPRSACTVDWTAWQDIGAAAKSKEMEALIKESGLSSIPPSEGTYWFLSEMALGNSPEVVIFEERMLHEWPLLGQRAEGLGERSACFDDRGVPLVLGAWPMVDYLVFKGPGEIQFERRLELCRDRFLDQHRLHNVPIVPATFGCEILAEAAALVAPWMQILWAEDIEIGVPVKLHREEPLLLRAHAQIVERVDDRLIVRAETRSHLFTRGRVVQADRLHHRGIFVLGNRRPKPEKIGIAETDGLLHARSFFHMTRDPILLGPLFCRAEWLQITADQVIGTVRSPRQRDILRNTAYPVFQVDPLLMDAAFQIAANWDGHHNGQVSLPLGLEKVVLGRPRRRAESARVLAKVRKVADPDVFYDVVVAGDEGDLLMKLVGVHLHRIGRIAS